MKNCALRNNNFFKEWSNNLNEIKNQEDFETLAIKAFKFQYQNNSVYRQWCDYTCKEIESIKKVSQIPFLPISFFKTKDISSGKEMSAEDYFLSSGTTSMQRSKHIIYDKEFYIQNTFNCFEQFFGKVENFCYLCLLPNYLEQTHSSLICMMDAFVKKSKYKESGFFKDNLKEVASIIKKNEEQGIKTILFGVTYALLDLLEIQSFQLKNTIIFETGGMKGRRKEISKTELHEILSKGFGIDSISSEYGMCELLSQAYSLGNGLYKTPKQMRICIREVNDRKSNNLVNHSGVINIIDLANIATCCFIETEDVGRMNEKGEFEILGRLDHSALRGCNLMYAE